MSTRLPHLLSTFTLGSLKLPNRVVMAPMTRSRAANAERAPFALHAEYYRQRASAGLLIAEATSVSPQGVGYVFTPGLWSAAQVEGWKLVTRTVHDAGGRIFAQLWHVGRVSHSAFQPGGALPVSSSAVAYEGTVMLPDFSSVPVETPRALETSEIAGIVKDFATGSQHAKDAGFDGVEIHGANSYLIDQFLRDGCNQRTDAYGGSIENRARFALEVVDAVVAVWGPGRVGIRLSPSSPWNGMRDSDPVALYTYLARELAKRPLAYVHVNESATASADGKASGLSSSSSAPSRRRRRASTAPSRSLQVTISSSTMRSAKISSMSASAIGAAGTISMSHPCALSLRDHS